METRPIVKFHDWLCRVEYERYSCNDRIVLKLVEIDQVQQKGTSGFYDDSPIATATVNIPQYHLPNGFVIIKDYSENEGIYDALHEAGYISEPVHSVKSGFVECPVCELLIKQED